jgi:hypothetical protein
VDTCELYKGKAWICRKGKEEDTCSRLQDLRRDCRSVGLRSKASGQLQSVKVSLYVYKDIS